MKLLHLKILILFYIFIPLSATFSNTKDEIAKIKSVLNQQQNDWSNGNIEKYMEGYWNSDSLLFIGKNGPKYGWNQTLENYKKSYPDKSAMGKLKFDFLKIELQSKSTAIIIGKWELKRDKDSPNGYFSLVLKKIKGKWKIVIDHSS